MSEAALISVGLFIFSVLTSTPFAVITKLKKMFEEPGDYDYIAFCVEDLPQLGQVNTTIDYFFLRNFSQYNVYHIKVYHKKC